MAQDLKNISFIEGLKDFEKHFLAPSPDWLKTVRQDAFSRALELGIPTVKNEEWKYTNVAPITQHKYRLPKDKGKLTEKEQFDLYCDPAEVNLVFLNGVFCPELSQTRAPAGIRVSTIAQAVKGQDKQIAEFFNRYSSKDETAFTALNKALAEDGAYLIIEDKAFIEPLVHIVHITSSGHQAVMTSPRSLIAAGKSSQATVLESHLTFSDGITYFTNALTDIFMSENAVLTYCKAQGESRKAYHIGTTRVRQERNSNFNGFSMVTGGAITRNNLDIALNDEGISSMLNGLYCVSGDQLVDNHTAVDHRFPNCVSNQLYKGILNGSSRAVFNGKIFVKPIAQKTNSYQLNKNLLLGKGCRVDTKPQLEIFADDVKCTHGATIGQLNEDEVFYLQSRAISKKAALKMLARGFVDDILAKIPNASICRKLNVLLEPTFAAIDPHSPKRPAGHTGGG